MRKPQVKGGPGRSWGGPGRSWAGPGEFLEDFWRSGGPKKKLHFRKANRMKLSGTNYPLLKTENLLLIQGSISEKLSLYRFFGPHFWPARVLGGRHRARGAGPDREISKNMEKHCSFWLAWAGPGSGISVLRILLSPSKP